MRHRQTVALIALLAIILALSGSMARAAPGSPLIGVLAPVVVPALMTLYLILLLVNSKWIVEAFAAFLMSRPKKEGDKTNFLAVILAYAIVIVLAVALLRLGLIQRAVTFLQQSASSLSQAGGQSLTTPEGPNLSPTSIALEYYSIVMLVAIVLASLCLGVLGFHRALTYVGGFPATKEDEQLRREALQAVKQALASLKETGKYHDTILECYRQMCKILSDEGFVIAPIQTAREFASDVSGRLSLGRDFVTGLTFLFEEARYSDHPIDDEKRKLAVNELQSLQRALASNVGG
jgi:hypothetical protein